MRNSASQRQPRIAPSAKISSRGPNLTLVNLGNQFAQGRKRFSTMQDAIAGFTAKLRRHSPLGLLALAPVVPVSG